LQVAAVVEVMYHKLMYQLVEVEHHRATVLQVVA